MQKSKPAAKSVRKHNDVQRDTMEDIRELQSSPKYVDPNRDRSMGDADRTGRHFDEATDEGTAASKDHEAD
jgi:hypothetical protein